MAAEHIGIGKDGLKLIANGKRALSDDIAAKIKDALGEAGEADAFDTGIDAPPPAPLPITAWDGKRRDLRIETKDKGKVKVTTIKGLPGPMVDLGEMIAKLKGGPPSKADLARAIGYANWSSIDEPLKKDVRYRKRLHEKVIYALRGEVMPGKEAEVEPDKFTMGIAITFTTLANYERIEEVANILGGVRLFRKGTKIGYIVIYRFKDAGKTGQFKRLALRDANEIVCP